MDVAAASETNGSTMEPKKRPTPDSASTQVAPSKKARAVGIPDIRKILYDHGVQPIPDSIDGLVNYCGLEPWKTKNFEMELRDQLHQDAQVRELYRELVHTLPEVRKVTSKCMLALTNLCTRMNSIIEASDSEFEINEDDLVNSQGVDDDSGYSSDAQTSSEDDDDDDDEDDTDVGVDDDDIPTESQQNDE